MLRNLLNSVFNKQPLQGLVQHKLHLYLCDTQSYVFVIEIRDSDLEYTLEFTDDSDGCLCVDWGDGSESTKITNFKDVYKHTYTNVGKYNILLYHPGSRWLMIDLKRNDACSTRFQVVGWTWPRGVWARILLYIFT